jgi:DNA repair protein RadD
VLEYFDVSQVYYYLHEKAGSPPSIRVEYFCDGGMHKFNEWVCLEHSGFPGKKARDWWRQRFPGDYVPDTTADGLKLITELRVPHRIKVHINKKNPEVVNYEYQ